MTSSTDLPVALASILARSVSSSISTSSVMYGGSLSDYLSMGSLGATAGTRGLRDLVDPGVQIGNLVQSIVETTLHL